MVFKLFNVGSFYVAATAKGKIEIVINWLFPQLGHQFYLIKLIKILERPNEY